MKSEREIREKIDEYMEKIDHDVTNDEDIEKNEKMCCIIDALLWVIGDTSGKPI